MQEAPMNSMKATGSTDAAVSSFMVHPISEHNIALLLVCIGGLVTGLPLAVNKFWHLQVIVRYFGKK